jgi:lysophospholipase L1-like esterase
MRSVLCYGDSNTWGHDPATGERFGRNDRWPGVLRAHLGDDVEVIEEGLSGRTSAYDDPLDSNLNGLTFLPVCLATHPPLDVVVLFLGTNDLFLPGGFTAQFAAQGVGALVDVVARSTVAPDGGPPKSLVVVPPPFAPLSELEPWSPHGVAESARFSEAFQRMTTEHPCPLLDLRGVVESSPIDGIHFDVPAHAAIGAAVADALADLT